MEYLFFYRYYNRSASNKKSNENQLLINQQFPFQALFNY